MPTKRFSTMSICPMPLRPPISFSARHDLEGAELLAVDAHRHARLEGDRHRFDLVRRLLRRDGHAELDQLDAVDRQVFELARLVADVQAVLVGAVRLGDRRLDRDVLLLAVGDHLGAAGELLAELLDPPGGDHLDARVEGLGGQLEAALVVALAGGAVGVGVGADLAGDLQADLRDQRPGDRRAQQVDAFVLGLPLQHGEGEVAAQFLLGVDDPGRLGADVPGLLQNRLAILARLAQVDVHGVDVVALVHQPAENDRSIQSARIGQNTTRHSSNPPDRETGLRFPQTDPFWPSRCPLASAPLVADGTARIPYNAGGN